MKATIHLLPWSRGTEAHSIDVSVPDSLSAEAAATHLFEASNLGEATAPSRSMSVGDVAEVFTPTGRVLLGCCSMGWLELPVRIFPELSHMSSDLRGRFFDGLAERTVRV